MIQKRAAEISGRPKSLKHFAKTGRGDLREAQILETLCKNGPCRIVRGSPVRHWPPPPVVAGFSLLYHH